MITRRTVALSVLTLPLMRPSRAANTLQLFAGDARPLAISDGPRRGIVIDIVQEAIKTVGRDLNITFLPFAEATKRTRETPGALMSPLARNAQREAEFSWVARIIDVPQAMGTLAARGSVDLEGARKLARIGVARGGIQESFLKEKGFSNLVVYASGREIAAALANGEIDAWYATAPQIAQEFRSLGRLADLAIGPTLQVAPAWLAANLDVQAIPVKEIAEAVSMLEKTGAVERIYKSYISA